MQNICIKSNVDITSVNLNPTGQVINIDGQAVEYILEEYFASKHEVSDRSLRRFYDKVRLNVSEKDQPRYFVRLFGKYILYSDRILEFRKNGRSKSKINTSTGNTFKAGKADYKLTLLRWLKSERWKYKCTTSYMDEVSEESCNLKMKKLFQRLSLEYPNAVVTLFYTTEKNEGRPGFHNHFVISIKSKTGEKLHNVRRYITTLFKSIGSEIYQIGLYKANLEKDWLSYITKHINVNPSSWWLWSTLPDNELAEALGGPKGNSKGNVVKQNHPRDKPKKG